MLSFQRRKDSVVKNKSKFQKDFSIAWDIGSLEIRFKRLWKHGYYRHVLLLSKGYFINVPVWLWTHSPVFLFLWIAVRSVASETIASCQFLRESWHEDKSVICCFLKDLFSRIIRGNLFCGSLPPKRPCTYIPNTETSVKAIIALLHLTGLWPQFMWHCLCL